MGLKVLMYLIGNLNTDARVSKEIETLINAEYEISIAVLSDADNYHSQKNGCPTATVLPIKLISRKLPKNYFFWPLKFFEMTLRFVKMGVKEKPAIIHCHDRFPLLATFIVSAILGIPYIYDSHEIESEREAKAGRPKFFWLALERYIAKRAQHVITTDHYRADILTEILGLQVDKALVLMNLPKISKFGPEEKTIKDYFPEKKIVVYTGNLAPGRNLENIARSVALLPENIEIILIGSGDSKYKSHLQEMAKAPRGSKELHIFDPLVWSKLVNFIRTADCGVAFYTKTSLNNLYCSPNKLFEYLMAGLPIVASDNPLIKEILLKNSLGLCLADIVPRAIAGAILEILASPDLEDMKTRARVLAESHYNWEVQEQKLIDLYTELDEG
jgi:glycosyltransferase involved in cell wall biosynthesis